MLLTSAARSVSVAQGFSRRAASTIASKYSKAVFGAALAKSPATLNKVATDLSGISNAIKTQPEVATFISNPTLSQQEREKGILTLLSKVEGTGAKKDQASEITKNLLALLSENGRLGETEGVIEGFNELFAEHKGELTVTVTSAAPLAKDVLTRLETTLKASQAAQKAKVVKITNKVSQ
jgi:F-type H+-transporting ATPase subunit O